MEPFTRLTVDSTGPVQVTLLPLPRNSPRLSLCWRQTEGALYLELTAQHGKVTLRGAGWDGGAEKGQLLSIPMIVGGIALLAYAYRARAPSGNFVVAQ